MQNPAPFNPGFRLSMPDCLVLAAGVIGAFLAAKIDTHLGLAIAFTVGHFFLFCNVVRMERVRELVWAATFVTLAALTISLQAFSWNLTFLVSLALTGVLLSLELRSRLYHGAFWQRINPSLETRWREQKGGVLS